MSVFPKLQLEAVIQSEDQTRLYAGTSFITQDENPIEEIWIRPKAAGTFVKVYDSVDNPTAKEDWYLDYAYEDADEGTVTATVRIVIDAANNDKNFTLEVITAANDKLLSADSDLITHEPDILGYVVPGRSSYLDIHRQARDRILAYLDERRIWDTNEDRLTKDSLTDKEEFKSWSKFEALVIIFEGLSNAVDDIFALKAERYRELRNTARNRGAIRLDRDGDGNTDPVKLDLRSGALIRR